MNTRHIAAAALATALLHPVSGWALGLGGIKVNSALNQPLDAEVELLLGSGERLEGVTARLADRDAYGRLGVHRGGAVEQITFKAEQNATGQAVLRLRTRGPVVEPILEVILDVRWKGGRLLREYPVLLDPPTYAAPAAAPALPAPASPAPVRAVTKAAPHQYQVRRGDTLTGIARQLRSARVTTEQMAVALFQANPQAFMDANMNRLRSGATLAVPTPEVVAAIGPQVAEDEMRRQTQAWRTAAPVVATPSAAAQAPVAAPGKPASPPPASVPEPALQILAPQPLEPSPYAEELHSQLERLRRSNAQLAEENDELRRKLEVLEDMARRLADRVVAEPVAGDAAPSAPEAVAPAPAPASAPAVVVQPAEVVASAEAPIARPWWGQPRWWAVLLLILVGGALVVLGMMYWRPGRRWDYRDFVRAMESERTEQTQRLRQASGGRDNLWR